MKKTVYLLLVLLVACQGAQTNNKNEADKKSSIADVSENRENPFSQAVAEYDVPLDDALNNWHFTVKLYETTKRFTYRIDMRYEEMIEADSITFPNFGIDPKPQINKGDNKLECIIGFLDKKGEFRKYKKIYADKKGLHVKTVQGYNVVATKGDK